MTGAEALRWQIPDFVAAQTRAQRTSLTRPRSHSPFDGTLHGSYLFLRIDSSRKFSFVFIQNESKVATGFCVCQPQCFADGNGALPQSCEKSISGHPRMGG